MRCREDELTQSSFNPLSPFPPLTPHFQAIHAYVQLTTDIRHWFPQLTWYMFWACGSEHDFILGETYDGHQIPDPVASARAARRRRLFEGEGDVRG